MPADRQNAGMTPASPPLPRWDRGAVVVPAPGDGPGSWAGAPSAVLVDGVTFLAYRLRRPLGFGRGYANVVARLTDGRRLERVAMLPTEAFGAESLQRPALVVRPDGGFRIYVSCATPDSKHWRVDAIDAEDPGWFSAEDAVTVLPGSDEWAVKDPVVLPGADRWQMWATLHPLESAEDADRMQTWYATSPDGLAWDWHGPALEGRPGAWDARGARVTAVVQYVAYYDGRATANENFEERTGLAYGSTPDRFTADANGPAAESPHGSGGLRYLSVLALPDGGWRLFYEGTRADGAHELRTEVVPSVPRA
jgi:hypothetical protein